MEQSGIRQFAFASQLATETGANAAMVGTGVISVFYVMIMYFNDNRFTPGEFAGMAACAAVIAAASAVLYGVYRVTRGSVCRQLGIRQRPGRRS